MFVNMRLLYVTIIITIFFLLFKSVLVHKILIRPIWSGFRMDPDPMTPVWIVSWWFKFVVQKIYHFLMLLLKPFCIFCCNHSVVKLTMLQRFRDFWFLFVFLKVIILKLRPFWRFTVMNLPVQMVLKRK